MALILWTLARFVLVSFVTDVYSRRILGWRMSAAKTTPLVMTAQEQALFALHRGNAAFTHSTAVSPCLPSFRRMKTASPPMSYRIVAIGCMYFGHSDKFDGWVELRKGR